MSKIEIIDNKISGQIIYRPDQWWSFEASRIGFKHYRKGYLLDVENYDIFQLIYIIDGSLHLKTSKYDTYLMPGTIMVQRLGSNFIVSAPTENCEIFSYISMGDFRNEFIGESEIFNTDNSSQRIIDLIIDNIDFNSDINLELLDSLSNAMWAQVNYLLTSNIRINSKGYAGYIADKAKILIDNSLRSGKNLKEVLAGVGLSYRQISRYFFMLNGITLKQYQIKVKMQEVKQMLLYDSCSITMIAYDLGFSSGQHLARQFKKHFAITPSEYRLQR